MKAPCLGCHERTVSPNCHGTCERYKEYNEYRIQVRELKMREHEEEHLRIVGARKIRDEAFRRKK